MRLVTPLNPIHWIDTPALLRKCIDDLRHQPVIGLDVETVGSEFELSLIQIATPGTNYLIDPLSMKWEHELSIILAAPKIIKLIHNAEFERKVFKKGGLCLDGICDTMEVAREAGGGMDPWRYRHVANVFLA